MKLRQKTILLILVIYIPLIAIFYVGVRTVMTRNHRELERYSLEQNLMRVNNALQYELVQLDALNVDWSAWDDTYDFVYDRNQDYFVSNLIQETYEASRLYMIAILSESNELVYGQVFDAEQDKLMPLPADLKDTLTKQHKLLTPVGLTEGIRGYIRDVPYPLLVTSRHIITSKNEGPSRGLLLMARRITPEFVHQINEITQQRIEIIADRRLMSEEESLIERELERQLIPFGEEIPIPIAVTEQGEDVISGYMLAHAIDGEAAFLICGVNSRDIYQSGLRAMKYMVLYIIVIGIVSGFIMLELLERFLVARMIRLSYDLKRIAEDPDSPILLTESKNDELTSITRHINHLVKVLSARRQALLNSEERYRSFVQHFQGIAYRTDLHNQPIFFHGAVKTITGYEEEELLNNNPSWQSLVYPGDIPQIKESNEQCMNSSFCSCERQYRIQHRDGSIRWVHEYMQHSIDRQSDTVFRQGAIYDITRRKKDEELLRETKDRMNLLARHLQQARETESSRIARRIHDDLGQLLMALKIDMRWLAKNAVSGDRAQRQMQVTLDILQQIESSINNISSDLKPSVLDSLGLEDAVQWLVNTFEDEQTVVLRFESDIGSLLSCHDFNTTVYRIVQEAMINAYRHAKASEVEVSMHVISQKLIVCVKDNGVGIPDDRLQAYESFGLIQMRERAESIRGKLEISTDAGCGTDVRLTVSLDENETVYDTEPQNRTRVS